MKGLLVVGLAFALLASGTAHGKKSFVIDHRGARPRGYRITALCQGIWSHISPDVFHSTLFSSDGKNIKATNIGLGVGMQDGRAVLILRDWSSVTGPERYDIIGDASNLDEMLPDKGIKIHGYQEWDMLSLAWRLKVEVEPGTTLKPFTGTLFGYEAAMARLLRNVAALGQVESRDNMKVLVSFYTQFWWHLIPSSQMAAPDTYVEEARRLWFHPVSTAGIGFYPAQRKALAEVNEAVLEGCREVLDYYQKPSQDWVPQEKKDLLARFVKMLQDLQEDLEK